MQYLKLDLLFQPMYLQCILQYNTSLSLPLQALFIASAKLSTMSQRDLRPALGRESHDDCNSRAGHFIFVHYY